MSRDPTTDAEPVLTQNTAACIECGAIAGPDARYCETCGAPVMSAPVVPGDDETIATPRIFESCGPAGATAAASAAVVSGPFWIDSTTTDDPSPAAASEPVAPVAEPARTARGRRTKSSTAKGSTATAPAPSVEPAAALAAPVVSAAAAADAARPAPAEAAPAPAEAAPAPAEPRQPVMIGTPAPARPAISAAIPAHANARRLLEHPTERVARKKSPSYHEQYADTQFAGAAAPAPGSPPPPRSGPLTAAENDPPWRRIGCLRAITVVLGLNWLIPGVIGLVADGILVRGGAPFGEAFSPDVMTRFQAAITVVGIVHLVWILVGVKILVAPGRWSLGISGLSFFIGAIGILVLLSTVHDPTPAAIAVVGVIALFEVVLGLMALTAAQSMD